MSVNHCIAKMNGSHLSLNCLVTLLAQNCEAFFISSMYGPGAGSCVG